MQSAQKANDFPASEWNESRYKNKARDVFLKKKCAENYENLFY